MAYTYLADTAGIIASVRNRMAANLHFKQMATFRSNETLYDLINDCLAEVYSVCGYQPDNWTINTVVGTYEYPIDGSANNFPNEVHEILAVEYNGSRLKYREFYPETIQEPDSDETDDPTKWYEKWDGGKRYLGLGTRPAEVTTLTIIGTRKPVVVSATTIVPGVDTDFQRVMAAMLIRECLRVIELAQMKDMRFSTEWDEKAVQPGLHDLRCSMAARKGRKARRLGTRPAANDMLE